MREVSCVHTVSLGKSPAIASKTIVIHSLHHHGISFQIVAHVVVVRTPPTTTATVAVVVFIPSVITTTVLQAIDLLLPLVRRLLRLLKLFSQLLNLAILFSIALLLFMLLALIGDPIVETHGGGEGADQRGGQRCHDEGFLRRESTRLLETINATAYLEVLLLDPCCVIHPGGCDGEHPRSRDLQSMWKKIEAKGQRERAGSMVFSWKKGV